MVIIENPQMKLCPRCKNVLSKRQFFSENTSKDGVSFACRRCESKRKKEARLNNPELVEKHRANGRRWYKNNKEHKNAQNKAWKENNPNKFREGNLKSRFGITIQDFNNQLVVQKNRCAVCGIHADELTYYLSVDHCHKTGALRGLLCKKCNLGLGHFNDDIKILKAAVFYLEQCST